MKRTMNTINQTFNSSRFVATLRKEIVENSRTILFAVIGMYAMLTIFMLLGNLVNHNPAEQMIMMKARVPYTVVLLALSIVVCVTASIAFKGLTTKAGRTSLFMSPSSSLEKFLVNVLIYVVVMLVMFFACAQLADLTRIAVLKGIETKDFAVPGPINFLKVFSALNWRVGTGTADLAWLATLTMFLDILSKAALFFLGSVVWPRLSLLKTFVTLFVIQSVLAIFLVVTVVCFIDHNVFVEWLNKFMNTGTFFIVSSVLSVIEIVVSFALAWYLFKRKDVVSLKWWK